MSDLVVVTDCRGHYWTHLPAQEVDLQASIHTNSAITDFPARLEIESWSMLVTI